MHQTRFTEVQPADLRLGLEDERVEDQHLCGIGWPLEGGGVAPGLRILLQSAEGDCPLGLNDGAGVGPGDGERKCELDGQFVPWRIRAGRSTLPWRGAYRFATLGPAGVQGVLGVSCSS